MGTCVTAIQEEEEVLDDADHHSDAGVEGLTDRPKEWDVARKIVTLHDQDSKMLLYLGSPLGDGREGLGTNNGCSM